MPEIFKRHGVWIFEDRECIGESLRIRSEAGGKRSLPQADVC
jgi:hypothetical protein